MSILKMIKIMKPFIKSIILEVIGLGLQATIETLVKVGDLEEPWVALIDHGLEIDLMSKSLYQKRKWTIDIGHGSRIREIYMVLVLMGK